MAEPPLRARWAEQDDHIVIVEIRLPSFREGLGHLAALRALKGASRRRLLVALHDLDCRAARPYPPSSRNEIPDRRRLFG